MDLNEDQIKDIIAQKEIDIYALQTHINKLEDYIQKLESENEELKQKLDGKENSE